MSSVVDPEDRATASRYIPAGGSVEPASADSVAKRWHYLVQDGPAVFKTAVANMADVTAEILKRSEAAVGDVAWSVPHQANGRVIEAVARRLGLGLDRVIIKSRSLREYGRRDNSHRLRVERAEAVNVRRPSGALRLRSRLHLGERLPPLDHRFRWLAFRPHAPAILRPRSIGSSTIGWT